MLLLSLEGEDVLQAVQLLFEVFSDEGDCSLTEEEFMELFRPFAARDRLMKGVDGFVEKLTAHLQETAASKNGRISFDDSKPPKEETASCAARVSSADAVAAPRSFNSFSSVRDNRSSSRRANLSARWSSVGRSRECSECSG